MMKTYYINQKIFTISDKYYIYDINMQPFFEVRSNKLASLWDNFLGNIISIGHQLTITEMTGNPLLTIKKKVGFFGQDYEIYDQNEKISSIHTHLKTIKPKISIQLNETNYSLKGDILGNKFSIYQNEIEVAKITKKRLDYKDRYKIDIFDETHELLFLCTVIILDNSYHN